MKISDTRKNRTSKHKLPIRLSDDKLGKNIPIKEILVSLLISPFLNEMKVVESTNTLIEKGRQQNKMTCNLVLRGIGTILILVIKY